MTTVDNVTFAGQARSSIQWRKFLLLSLLMWTVAFGIPSLTYGYRLNAMSDFIPFAFMAIFLGGAFFSALRFAELLGEQRRRVSFLPVKTDYRPLAYAVSWSIALVISASTYVNGSWPATLVATVQDYLTS